MTKITSLSTIAGAFASLTFLGAAPSLALSPVTFVSGKGTDRGTCASPAAPCRSFQFAFGQTSPGGEIKALDPAPYGPVTITNSISITGVEGASINAPSGNHITINAGPNDTINLSQLTLDGFKAAKNSIVFKSGGLLTISHCTARNFKEDGIFLGPTKGAAKFLIIDTLVSDNFFGFVADVEAPAATAEGTLDHVVARKNNSGIAVFGHPAVLAVDTTAVDNNVAGFTESLEGAILRLAHSTATGNAIGVGRNGQKAESLGDNFIAGNSSVDVDGNGILPLVRPQ